MATIEFWIQIENRAWDVCPKDKNRMSGQTQEQITGDAPVPKTLTSPETGVTRTVMMFRPLAEDALILRRYTENWAAPDDRKVNPWDLNEPDPTDNGPNPTTDYGTMGTIPGATIECNVGDTVIVHFRNKDFRAGKAVKARTHSLHPHGIVFAPAYDGAYPLSPTDPTQPIPASEATAWSSVGVPRDKMGDRVPPGGTFTYTWDTFGWPSTAGVWHYHDHSICDVENVNLGAIGFLVIHNPDDPDDVIDQDLPHGEFNGPLKEFHCFPFPFPPPLFPLDLIGLAPVVGAAALTAQEPRKKRGRKTKGEDEVPEQAAPVMERAVIHGDLLFEVDKDFLHFVRICVPTYVDPPSKAQYLQYYHEMPGVGMTINGRKYLGNTPTLIAGPETKMRFGLAAMNNVLFHTFHLHGHRWTIPGPKGNTPAEIQSSVQNQAASQFEDTKIFGPANSFSFTINQGSFMGSRFTSEPERAPGVGEWHMHCHVLHHMMGPGPTAGGMMGSLKVIQGGELAFFDLPVGEPCPPGEEIECAQEVTIGDSFYSPVNVAINAGQTVCWTNTGGAPHTVSSNKSSGQIFNCAPVSSEEFESGTLNSGDTFDNTFNTPGNYPYHCEVHGCSMAGTVTVI